MMNCEAASNFCDAEISEPFFATGRFYDFPRPHTHVYTMVGMNPYDLSKVCDGPIEETLCYPITL